MSYEIITLDEKAKMRVVWGTFHFSDNKRDCERIVSFLRYLKGSANNFSDFLIYEVETGKAFKLSAVFDNVVNKLSAYV